MELKKIEAEMEEFNKEKSHQNEEIEVDENIENVIDNYNKEVFFFLILVKKPKKRNTKFHKIADKDMILKSSEEFCLLSASGKREYKKKLMIKRLKEKDLI